MRLSSSMSVAAPAMGYSFSREGLLTAFWHKADDIFLVLSPRKIGVAERCLLAVI
jgi:hypothetical protein